MGLIVAALTGARPLSCVEPRLHARKERLGDAREKALEFTRRLHGEEAIDKRRLKDKGAFGVSRTRQFVLKDSLERGAQCSRINKRSRKKGIVRAAQFRSKITDATHGELTSRPPLNSKRQCESVTLF